MPIICGIRPPVKNIFDEAESLEDMRKAWAEAVHLYKTLKETEGAVKLILPKAVQAEAMERQAAALEADPWQEPIEKYLCEIVNAKREKGGIFPGMVTVNTTARDIYINAFDKTEEKELTRGISQRINKIVDMLPEWAKVTTVKTESGRGRGYRFQHTAEETDVYVKAFKYPGEINNQDDVDGKDAAENPHEAIVNYNEARKRRTV